MKSLPPSDDPTMSALLGEAMSSKSEAIADRKQHRLSRCMNSSASMVRAIPITPRMTIQVDDAVPDGRRRSPMTKERTGTGTRQRRGPRMVPTAKPLLLRR